MSQPLHGSQACSFRGVRGVGVVLAAVYFSAASAGAQEIVPGLTVSPAEVTGSEPLRATIDTTRPGVVRNVVIRASHPSVVILPDPPIYAVNGVLEIVIPTLPVSETTELELVPIFQGGSDEGHAVYVRVKAPILAGAEFASDRVPGGDPVVLVIQLSHPAGDTGAIIDLATSDAAALPVPAQAIVEPGETEQRVPLFSLPVSSTTAVTVNAMHGGAAFDAVVLIDGLNLTRLSVDRAVVAAGEQVMATVEVGVAAPIAGLTIALSVTDPAHAVAPAQVTIPAGGRTATFVVTTLAAAQDVDVRVQARLGGAVLEQSFHVSGATLLELNVVPPVVPGGLTAVGRVALQGLAPPGGASVLLWSDDSVLASPPSGVVVPPGESAAEFPIPTARAERDASTSIRAQYLDRTVATVIEVLADAVVEGGGIDLPSFEDCMLGPDVPAGAPCTPMFDPDADRDVDLRDFAALQPALGAVLVPAPPSFTTDGSLVPAVNDLPGYDGVTPRNVVAVRDASGAQAEFVEDEVILATDSPEELADFLARWQGQVLHTFSPLDLGFEGTTQHLVRINTMRGDTASLPGLLRALDPRSYGQHLVSSAEGMGLLAAAAEATASGIPVGINWVARPTAYRDRFTTEHATGPALTDRGSTPEPYNQSTAQWSYLRSGGTQDIGVIEAWRMLDRMGRFQNKVRIGVLDRGFSVNADFPRIIDLESFVPFSSGVDGVGDGDCPSPCPWHASGVVCCAMGVPDNNFGAAGPAGPVGELVGVRCLGDIFSTPFAIAHAVGKGARIINMSFGGSVPASLSWSLAQFNAVTGLLRSKGVLLFAASGNDGLDVDRKSCFIACWESAWHFPCENAGVTCVGALTHNSRNRASYSNYGAEEVDIFGPGTLWTSPDPGQTMPRISNGTSEASPFVAGVAALVMAANPGLSVDQVEDILYRTANTSPDGNVRRYVNAYRAVLEAIGGNEPPYLKVLSPRDGGSYSYGFLSNPPYLHAEATDREDGSPTVNWQSSVDGSLGTGTCPSPSRELSPGQHVITVTATDRAGIVVTERVNITLFSPPPRVSIREPRNGVRVVERSGLAFRADTYDPDGTGFKVAEAGIVWSSNLSGSMGSGSRIVRVLTRGTHRVKVTATNAARQSASAEIDVVVIEGPPDFDPPPVVTIEDVRNLTNFPTGFDGSGRAYTDFEVQVFACDPEFDPCREVDNDNRIAWYTNRSDLQTRFLLSGRSGVVRLYGDRFAAHEITVIVTNNCIGCSPPESCATRQVEIPDFGPK